MPLPELNLTQKHRRPDNTAKVQAHSRWNRNIF